MLNTKELIELVRLKREELTEAQNTQYQYMFTPPQRYNKTVRKLYEGTQPTRLSKPPSREETLEKITTEVNAKTKELVTTEGLSQLFTEKLAQNLMLIIDSYFPLNEENFHVMILAPSIAQTFRIRNDVIEKAQQASLHQMNTKVIANFIHSNTNEAERLAKESEAVASGREKRNDKLAARYQLAIDPKLNLDDEKIALHAENAKIGRENADITKTEAAELLEGYRLAIKAEDKAIEEAEAAMEASKKAQEAVNETNIILQDIVRLAAGRKIDEIKQILDSTHASHEDISSMLSTIIQYEAAHYQDIDRIRELMTLSPEANTASYDDYSHNCSPAKRARADGLSGPEIVRNLSVKSEGYASDDDREFVGHIQFGDE